jgi:uncharacterized protein (TIGR03067 family)
VAVDRGRDFLYYAEIMAKVKTDLDKLQGSWTIIALEMDGAEMPAGAPGGSKIVVKGDKFTTISMGAAYDGTITLDQTKKPKSFDLKFTAGPEKGNTSLGIYELGGDNWKICLTVTGKTRPRAFATAPGSGLALETLRRDASAAAPDKSKPLVADVRFEAVAELQGEWSLVSLLLNGKPIDPGAIQYGKRVVKGDELTLKFGRDLVTKAKMAANPTKQPKIMDYVHVAGMMAGQSQQGIYELEGKILKICSSPPGQTRPSEFTATPKNGRTLAVWTKQ